MKRKCKNCGKMRIHISIFRSTEAYCDMCPICALKIRNYIHGLPLDTPFEGEVARAMYEEELKEEADL